MLLNSKFFNTAVGIILVLLIIYLFILIEPFVNLLTAFATTLLFPIFIATVLYYVTRPFREYMEQKKIPRIISIILIFVAICLCLSFAIIFIWPYLSEQIDSLTAKSPSETLKKLESKTVDIMQIFNITSASNESLRETLIFYLDKVVKYLSENIIFTIGSLTKIASYFVITPLLLFYFLKDDYRMTANMIKAAPTGYKKLCQTFLTDMDSTLEVYISGQVLIAFIVGVLIYFGYLVIGMDYAILLALIAFIFNLIPFCGPFISTIPALIVAFSSGPFMAFKVVVIVLLVHLLDLNLISPRIVGKRLNIHPVTVIILLVASLSIFGFLSIFFITPLYAVTKTFINDLYFEQDLQE